MEKFDQRDVWANHVLIPPNWNDMRTKLGYTTLAEIPHAALGIFKNMKEIILRDEKNG